MSAGRNTEHWFGKVARAILPDTLFLPGLPGAEPIAIHLDSLPLEEATRLQIKTARRAVRIVLAPQIALRRSLDIPKALGAKTEAAIGLQLRQTLPGQGQGLVWRAVQSARAGAMTQFSVFILKQSQIDGLLAELTASGADVDSVGFDMPGLRPLWQRRPHKERTARNWLAITAFSVVFAAVLAVVAVEGDRAELADVVSLRTQRVAALEERAVSRRAEADQQQETSNTVLSDLTLFITESRRLGLLADLANVLPDSVWVSEISISEDRLILSGFTPDEVTEVISAIRALPWAKTVELNGAIVFDTYSGQNRFQLSLSIVASGPT